MTTFSPQEQRICLITGAADGLGLSLAKHLSSTGNAVCLIDINEEKLAHSRNSIGERCFSYVTDITDVDSVNSTVSSIVTEFGRIDTLVNCAGITGTTNCKSHAVDLGDVRRVFEINFFGSLTACQAVIPHMLEKNYGRVLNVASIAGKEGNAGMMAYSSSKAAVIGMTKSMGKEYAETGITINAIAPAVIRTELVKNLPAAQVQYMTDRIPMKRCGTLEEFAAMAAFIVSPGNSFSTGFTFDLSGGRTVY